MTRAPKEINVIQPGQATDLQVLESLTPETIFSEDGSRALVEKIRAEVTGIVPDIETKDGRKAIAALAYKVAQSKTLLDKIGKTLNADIKEKAKIIDRQRAVIWDELESIQKTVRAPLTEWEENEESRVQAHTEAMEKLEALAKFDAPPTTGEIDRRLTELEKLAGRDWEEHKELADETSNRVRADLKIRLEQSIKADADALELERLRKMQAEREAEDQRRAAEDAEKKRQQQHAADVAEAARVGAEKAKAEEAARVRAAEDARAKAEADAQRERDSADARAKQAAEDATRREQERAAEEKRKEEEDQRRREANQKHRAKVNNAVLKGIMAAAPGLKEAQAKAIVEAIVKDKVQHTKISY